jgi:hypothetical protein
MTVRHMVPVIDPVAPLDLIVEDLHDILDNSQTTTTPQVAEVPEAGETAVRKGVQAR